MKLSSRVAMAGVCLAVAGTASAQSNIQVNGFFGGNNFGQNVNISLDGSSRTVGAGPLEAQVDGGSLFPAYCVDLTHTTTFGSSWNVNVLSSSGGSLTNGALAGQLVNNFAPSIANSDQGTALQLAIWSAIYNGSVTASGSHFSFSGVSTGVQNAFNTIASMNLTGVSGSASYYSALSHGSNNEINQNLIAAGAPVPEPASMLACAVGLVGLVRRKKKA